MSNVNDFEFSKYLESFKVKILDHQKDRVAGAEVIMQDKNHQWKDETQRAAAGKQLEIYRAWLLVYQTHYDAGNRLIQQHEGLVNKMAKIYDSWYQNISNEGRMETEIMSSQADLLNELMGELYKELLPLKLEIKPPKGLNL